MKEHTIKFKRNDMLCHRCLINVVKTLNKIPCILELDVNLETKIIQIKFKGENISKEMIEEIVEQSIIYGKVKSSPLIS